MLIIASMMVFVSFQVSKLGLQCKSYERSTLILYPFTKVFLNYVNDCTQGRHDHIAADSPLT